MGYKLQTNGVKRLSDGAFIPEESGNRDWREYQEWLAEGNEPAPQFTKEEIRQQKHAQINALRQQKILAGFTFEGNTYQSDPQSIANMTGKVLSLQTGKALPAGYTWRDADNNDVPHTGESLTSLAWALEDFVENLYKTSWIKKAELDATDDPASYDVEAGW